MSRAEYMRRWRQTPAAKEYLRRKSAKYRKEHPDVVRAVDRRRYQKRKDAVLRQNEKRRILLAGVCGSHTQLEWLELQQVCGQSCAYCGVAGVPLTKDHFIPISKGGSDDITNIVPACRSCNSSKRGIGPAEWAEWFLTRRVPWYAAATA